MSRGNLFWGLAMTDKPFERRSAHSRTGTKIDFGVVKVEFSPEVRRGFARLEAAVHDSKHFSPEILLNLQEYAEGYSVTVPDALSAIAHFTREAMKHVRATRETAGSVRTQKALDDLIAELMALNDDTPPITLVKGRASLPGERPRTAAKPYPDPVMVEFSSELRQEFARLEAAVHDSKHFSPEILLNLQEYAQGVYPLLVADTITGIANITREAMKRVNATSDKTARKALDSVIEDFMGLTSTSPHFTLTKVPQKDAKHSREA
jgi:hypothetical protein